MSIVRIFSSSSFFIDFWGVQNLETFGKFVKNRSQISKVQSTFLQRWFMRHSTCISKRNNIARYIRPRISKISSTGSEQPLDFKSTLPQRNDIEGWFQRHSTRIPKCNNVVSDTKPLSPTVREILPKEVSTSGTEVDRKKFPSDEHGSWQVLPESVLKKFRKFCQKLSPKIFKFSKNFVPNLWVQSTFLDLLNRLV